MKIPGKVERDEHKQDDITFAPEAVGFFLHVLSRTGKITPEQAAKVTSVLAEKGPQSAMEKLASFLQEIDNIK